MELTGTFEFSHVDMVVINRKDVFKRELVGKKQIPLWHKEHCPKVFKPDEIKEMIQGYLRSKWHRVNPSGNTINIYHKTKRELEAEKVAKEKLSRDLQSRVNTCRNTNTSVFDAIPVNEHVVGIALTGMRPGQLVTTKPR